ncbi:hypothetical protein [Clostridium grantii]|uniref:CARDB protein n=1 Tax=Clostridium grantii DSM 8605 TaxID=1121316 RepID=A0A1M5V847_9CLOT|nr:hypothetical protein [Clostridium grantii]SHH71254.1 hypothetical protein SAMN02745207_02151 [Clostridium grantii DSM 8605]
MKKIASFLILILLFAFIPFFQAEATQTKLLVEKISTIPTELHPGEKFSLEFALKNNGDRDLENVFITLKNIEGKETLEGFSPVESTNELFIGTIKKGESLTKSINLITSPNLTVGTYNLVVTVSFKEKDRSAVYDENKTIGLLIENKANLIISNLNLPNNDSSDDSNVEFVNSGKSLLSNVMIKLSTNGEESTQFYGDLDVGEQDTMDLEIPLNVDVNGIVEISFTDEMNREGKVSKAFKIDLPDESIEENSKTEEKKGFFSKIGSFFKAIFGLGN